MRAGSKDDRLVQDCWSCVEPGGGSGTALFCVFGRRLGERDLGRVSATSTRGLFLALGPLLHAV